MQEHRKHLQRSNMNKKGFFLIILVIVVMQFLWLFTLNKKIEQLLQQGTPHKQVLREDNNAQWAFKKAQEYLETGNIETAKIYALNAINQAPENIEYLVAYARLITDSKHLSLESLQQAHSIIELALYQLPAPAIETAQELLVELSQHHHRFVEELLDVDVTAFFDEDISQCAQYIIRLQTVLKDMASDVEEEDFTNRIRVKLDEATKLYDVARRIVSIEDHLHFFEQDTTDLSEVKAVAVFQSLSMELSQLLKTDVSEHIQKKIEDYLTQFERIEQQVNCARSQQPYQHFQEVYQQILETHAFSRVLYHKLYVDFNEHAALKSDPRHRHYYDYKLSAIKTFSTHARFYAQQVTCSHMRANVTQLLEKIDTIMSELQKQQYTAYQRWVVDQCYGAFTEYQQEWHVSKGDAGKLFKRWQLDSIEQSLLTLEVSQMFHDVVGKILGELSNPALITDYQKRMALTEKIVLEDF